jgi:GNAT superfamily N-acetyltransferase
MPANPIPLTAPTAEDFHAWHRVQSAALAHDRPDEPVPAVDAVRARLTTPGADSRVVLWLVRGPAQEPVATAALRLFSQPARAHLAEVDMTVHPAHRRLGAGSRLLSTVTDAARGAGCRSMVTEVTAGTPGEGFLAARDFTPVLRLTWLRLALEETPEQIGRLPDVPHAGYRLTAWDGVVPDELAAPLARARAATAGMLTGGLDLGDDVWDEARVRAAAEAVAGRGEHLVTVAAVSDADGEVAGWTELVLPADRSGRAQQYDTTVLPAHRGHGLGLWLKAAMLRRVRSRHPGITEIQADNADENRHMLAVNTALGFRPRHRTVKYRLDLRGR